MPRALHTALAHVRPGALAAVVVGGVAGTAARYGIALAIPSGPERWPTATFLINLAGAFLLGLLLEGLVRLGADSGWHQRERLLLGTGFLGSFTTYSALALETDRLVGGGQAWTGAAYLLASAVGGTVAAAAGVALAGFALRRAEPGGRA